MVHTVRWRVGSEDALDFWQKRLDNHVLSREDGRLTFVDPEGLRHELAVVVTKDEPLIAEHPEVPAELALQGFDGVRAFSADPERSREFLEQTLEFEPRHGETWEARGKRRGGFYEYDTAPEGAGIGGAGTVHHVAWASAQEEHEAWRERVAAAGAHVTPVIDRFYFKSIYFREPSGVLFEIATIGPGFATDEPIEHLGERLSLPPDFEHLRSQVEPVLTPLPKPRETAATR
jgi:glyoxalase family protein